MQRTRLAIIAAILALLTVVTATAQTTSQAGGGQPTDVQVYETFRAWANKQNGRAGSTVLERYRAELAAQSVPAAEIDHRLKIIAERGARLEVERWNTILTEPSPTFNTKPNAFLVRMIQDRKPGRALDVGMGQGRNAIYMAQQGWKVTGFDPAEKAVAAAQAEATRLGLTLTTHVAGDQTFDFGREQWDLILLSYVGARHLTTRISEALKPGGIVIVEANHVDATKNASIGRAWSMTRTSCCTSSTSSASGTMRTWRRSATSA
jgi:2-polyprenyl-3-methyl-5-hydroxy-6-metoxy-1,4-benzoquinol methylase